MKVRNPNLHFRTWKQHILQIFAFISVEKLSEMLLTHLFVYHERIIFPLLHIHSSNPIITRHLHKCKQGFWESKLWWKTDRRPWTLHRCLTFRVINELITAFGHTLPYCVRWSHWLEAWKTCSASHLSQTCCILHRWCDTPQELCHEWRSFGACPQTKAFELFQTFSGEESQLCTQEEMQHKGLSVAVLVGFTIRKDDLQSWSDLIDHLGVLLLGKDAEDETYCFRTEQICWWFGAGFCQGTVSDGVWATWVRDLSRLKVLIVQISV